MKHKFITIGEIMLRLTPPDYEKIRTATTFEARYGGSEANVALSLANLGIDASFFTVVPDNSLGKSAVRMMRSNDVNCDSIVYSTMNITVYLGALEGNDPALGDAVRELGTWIGESGNSLVYGGSKSGLMGQIAESVLNAGGKVTGVEPQFFIDSELQYDEITELIVTKDMAERKAKMIELGDAFIAFPGGTGTLEEITEVMSMVSLKHLNAPCILYNLNGYYDSLKQLLDHMIKMGLSSENRQQGIYFADDMEDIKALLPECV